MSINIERQFYTWVLPILMVNGFILTLAAWASKKHYYGTCQILISIVGLFFCFTTLWVETLLVIWYPDFDYLSPPAFTDPRPGRQKPYCDVTAWARCSVTTMSPYNRLLLHFGIAAEGGWMDWANATLGVMFFAMHILVVLLDACRLMEKKRNKPYHRYKWHTDPDDGCCDYCDFRCIMTTITFGACFFSVFQAWKFWYVLREFSVIHAASWIVNFAMMPAVLTPLEEDTENDRAKKHM